jgi:O-antigen/teichoic acid export membrane protein
MAILMSVGMRTALLRFTKEYETKNHLGTLLGTSITVNLMGGLAVTGIVLTCLIPIFKGILHTVNVYPYVGMVCGAAWAQALSTHIVSYYQAQNKALKYMFTGVSVAVGLLATTSIFVCVLGRGVEGAIWAFILTHVIVIMVASFDVLRKTGFGVSLSLAPTLIRFGFPLIFSMCSELTIGTAGVFFLSYFAGLETVAIYSLGYKLAQILLITTLSPFSLAFQPYVFSNLDNLNNKSKLSQALTQIVLAATFMSFCIILATRVFLPLIAPPAYAPAFLVVLLLVPGMAFIGVYYFGETLLTAVKKTYTIGYTATSVAIFSILLNYLLVRPLNWYGAVFSLNISFILVGCALAIIGIKQFSIILEWKRICTLACVFLSFLVMFFALRNFEVVPFTLVSVLVGLLCVSVLLRRGFFYEEERLAIIGLFAKLR